VLPRLNIHSTSEAIWLQRTSPALAPIADSLRCVPGTAIDDYVGRIDGYALLSFVVDNPRKTDQLFLSGRVTAVALPI